MPQSLSKIAIHLIFSTKNRERIIHDELRNGLHPHIAEVLNRLGCPPIAINSEPDHIHLLFLLGRTIAIADVVKEMKRVSSVWVKERDSRLQSFHWQSGYAAFSISESLIDRVEKYIHNQQDHHRTEPFQDEYRTWLKQYGIEFDERYVWD